MDEIVESQALEPVAFQEAGQAVMAFFEGVPVRPVKLQPEMVTDGGPGCLYAAHWPDWADPWSEKFSLRAGREWFEKRMAVTLAGAVAARLRLGQKESGLEVDWERARMAATGFWGGERVVDAWLRWLYARAEEAIEQPYAWQTVRTVAVELLNRRMLNGRVLANLIQETYRRQLPDIEGMISQAGDPILGEARPTEPVAIGCRSAPLGEVARGLDSLRTERHEQLQRELTAGVVLIDALRRTPESDEQ